MSFDALPLPHRHVPKGVRYHRVFLDALGRPLTGQLTLTLAEPVESRSTVVLPVAVTVDLAEGAINVHLAAGTYAVQARLRSPDGEPVVFSETVTLHH